MSSSEKKVLDVIMYKNSLIQYSIGNYHLKLYILNFMINIV